ncbi:MAG: hypothetical protein IKC13_01905 [Elusimicrobiaceae bacterium]|nr:hypothetical protein [Elusimicrobiaceae bacterium]
MQHQKNVLAVMFLWVCLCVFGPQGLSAESADKTGKVVKAYSATEMEQMKQETQMCDVHFTSPRLFTACATYDKIYHAKAWVSDYFTNRSEQEVLAMLWNGIADIKKEEIALLQKSIKEDRKAYRQEKKNKKGAELCAVKKDFKERNARMKNLLTLEKAMLAWYQAKADYAIKSIYAPAKVDEKFQKAMEKYRQKDQDIRAKYTATECK